MEDQIQARAAIVNNRHYLIGETETSLKSPPSATQLKMEILQKLKVYSRFISDFAHKNDDGSKFVTSTSKEYMKKENQIHVC